MGVLVGYGVGYLFYLTSLQSESFVMRTMTNVIVE